MIPKTHFIVLALAMVLVVACNRRVSTSQTPGEKPDAVPVAESRKMPSSPPATTVLPGTGDATAAIQRAIDATPGRMLYLPPGDYSISSAIKIHSDNSGLFGPGRIIQTNPDQAIVIVEKAAGVRLRDLTLTRPTGKMDTLLEGVKLVNCMDAVLDGLQLIDNRSRSGGLYLTGCVNCQILNCQVINYMSITIDDRTDKPTYGYAFNCIDGTAIAIRESRGLLIQGNSIIERNMLPTPEIKAKFKLGEWTKRAEKRGSLVSEEAWAKGYAPNWHQGSAIVVSSPLASDFTRVLGNYIENAAQGCDIHSDHLIFANNIINNAFFGMKACHGARNVIITGNQFSKIDLIAIALSPAASSRPASPAVDGKPAQPANTDGGHIIANNIISDFGFGNAHWMWSDSSVLPTGPTPISIGWGQLPVNPPLRDVLVTGNLIYDTGRDQILKDGIPVVEPPRYKYAVLLGITDMMDTAGLLKGAENVHFSNNLFAPGTEGVCNVELP